MKEIVNLYRRLNQQSGLILIIALDPRYKKYIAEGLLSLIKLEDKEFQLNRTDLELRYDDKVLRFYHPQPARLMGQQPVAIYLDDRVPFGFYLECKIRTSNIFSIENGY